MALIEIVPAATRDQTCDRAAWRLSAPIVQLLGGGALVLASYALWLSPGAAVSPSLFMVKLGLSVLMLTSGLGLFSDALHRKV